MKMIAISGPESSGKTTLVRDLVGIYDSKGVDEYARYYLETLHRPYEYRDLLAIGRGQEIEMLQARVGRPKDFLFLDTWAIVLMIWAEYKYQKSHSSFFSLLERYEVDHFLLCAPDIPWREDPLRENPIDRDGLFQLFKKKMTNLDLPFSVLRGDRKQKLQSAKGILDSLA